MKVVSIHETKRIPFIHPVFTGPEVTRQELLPESGEFDVTVVSFGKGVRNRLHAHEGEQILIATSGEGIVANRTQQRTVLPGYVIFIPAGEPHWHGATPETEFSHIYIQKKNSALTQIEQ